MRRPV